MQPFMESMPPEVDIKLQREKLEQEKVLIQVATDFIDNRTFGEKWLVLTEQHLLIIPTNGVDVTVAVPIEAIREAKIEELVGGGRLAVERKSGEPIYLHYSSSLIPKFTEVAAGIKQLSKLLYKDWMLTLYVLLLVPPIVLGGTLIWNSMERYWHRWSAKWARFSSQNFR